MRQWNNLYIRTPEDGHVNVRTCRGHLWEKIIVKLFASSWYIFLTYIYDARTYINFLFISSATFLGGALRVFFTSQGRVVCPEVHPCRTDHTTTLWTVQLSWTLQCQQYEVDSRLWRVQGGHYCVNNTRWTVRCEQYKLKSTVWPARSGQCKVESLRWTVEGEQFKVDSAVWTARDLQ